MGKKANEKRKQFFDELDKAGKLKGKHYKPHQRPKNIGRDGRRKEKPPTPPTHKPTVCCREKYNDLPKYFISCIDCPNEALDTERTIV